MQSDLKEGKVRPTLERWDALTKIQAILSGPSLAVHVPNRSTHSHRKSSPPRSAPYEAHTVALEEQLEGTESLEKVIPIPRSLHPHLKWWLEESNVPQGMQNASFGFCTLIDDKNHLLYF